MDQKSNITPVKVIGTPVEVAAKEEEVKKLRITKQFEDWVVYFLDKTNPITYGNKTQSALKAYNLDPVKQYHGAGQVGYENYKKLESLGSSYLESKGITAGRMLEIAVSKIAEAKNGRGKDWWEAIAKIHGLIPDEKMPQGGTNNTQINVYNLDAPEVKDFNKSFQKFLESQ